jgi:hypothetical protein
MKRPTWNRLLGLGICLAVVPILSVSQDRPNLSGIWQSDSHDQALEIELRQNELSITELRGLEHRLVYRLDGPESRNETLTARGETWVHVSEARWVGSSILVITETTREEAGGSWEWMNIYHLTGTGKLSVTHIDHVLGPDDVMNLSTTTYTRQ